VRELEHEQIKRRLRKAELEAKLLAVELSAAAQRVEDARDEVQSLQTTTSTSTIHTPSKENIFPAKEPSATGGSDWHAVQVDHVDREGPPSLKFLPLPPRKSRCDFELPFLTDQNFRAGFD